MTKSTLLGGRAGIDLGTFLQAVLDDEIKLVGKAEGIGLRCLLFSDSQISRYVRSEYRLVVGDAMTLREVTKSLSVSSDTVCSLVNKGFLSAETFESAPSLGRLVKREDFNTFNKDFILARKLASEHETSSAHVVNSLAARGVHPVMGRKIDSSRTYLFKTSDVAPLDVAPLDVAALIVEERKARLVILKSTRKEKLTTEDSKAKKSPTPKRYYYKPPPILSETQAAELLNLDVKTVRCLAEGGALKPHKRLSQDRKKGGAYYFSCYTVEKYKNRSVEHTGLVIFANAARMLDLWPDNFYNRYVKTGRLKPALDDGRRGDHYFRLEDLEALIEIEKQTIITPEAAEILGVNVSCVDKMMADELLTPISGPKVDGFGKNLFMRSDVEKLRTEREAFKARQLKKGETSRFGRPTARHCAV
ncbi:MAG: hypothetical protein QOG71_1864 [Pyrinomonadaceae bacterium]|nr:hypothetical protein [Pyrinomonadaceae bacterium]